MAKNLLTEVQTPGWYGHFKLDVNIIESLMALVSIETHRHTAKFQSHKHRVYRDR